MTDIPPSTNPEYVIVPDGLGSAATLAAIDASAAGVTLKYVGTGIEGLNPVAAGGTSYSNTNTYYLADTLSTFDRYVEKIEIPVFSIGGLEVVVSRLMGGSTMDMVSVNRFTLTATGDQVLTGLNIKVPAGCVIGVRRTSGGGYFTPATSAETQYTHSGEPGIGVPYTGGNLSVIRWRASFVAETIGAARDAISDLITVQSVLGEERIDGWPTPIISTGTNIPNNYTAVWPIAADRDGKLTTITVGSTSIASAVVEVYTINPTTREVLAITAQVPISIQPGVQQYVVGVGILKGQFWGIRATVAGAYKFQSFANPTALAIWLKTGSAVAVGNNLTSDRTHRYEISASIKSGIIADVQSPIEGSGLEVLGEADSSGLVDSTSKFSAAVAAHPQPYVRPGVFNVTALPANGSGLWGPGRIFVNNQRFFIPADNTGTSLFEEIRQRLSEHIFKGNVLSLVSDSIGHFAFSGTGPAHWFDRITKFVNHGIALDEPGMTALRPSSVYTTDFYGITVAGAVATGTTGPLAESLVLGVGASITFVGAYETIGVHYDQQAAAGTLSFAYNGGAAFHTVSAAGATVLDQFSSALTGQAASGTYTITATGGPVTITGLTRLGIKVVGSTPRMYTNRCAHGSYQLSSFQSAHRTSIMKQGRAFGGEAVPIIALGINDSFGTNPTAIATNAEAMVDNFIAQGAPEIFGILPLRPASSWSSSYTGGRTFTPAQGAIAGVYRRKGVKIIPMPVDFLGRTLFQDGLHPNVLGNDTYAQLCIEGICKR